MTRLVIYGTVFMILEGRFPEENILSHRYKTETEKTIDTFTSLTLEIAAYVIKCALTTATPVTELLVSILSKHLSIQSPAHSTARTSLLF